MTDVLWLARHGNREDFVDPGWARTAEHPFDPGLSPDGVEQAHRLGARLRGEGIRHVFTSPFLRTVETAHLVADMLDLPVHLEPGFGEWLNPAWFPSVPTRLAPETMARRFPRIASSHKPVMQPRYPETEQDAVRRAVATARSLARDYPGPILLVGHAVSVTGAASGLTGRGALWTNCALCSLFKLVRRGAAWTLALWEDVAHLDPGDASP